MGLVVQVVAGAVLEQLVQAQVHLMRHLLQVSVVTAVMVTLVIRLG
jgi:hypothetical protein